MRATTLTTGVGILIILALLTLPFVKAMTGPGSSITAEDDAAVDDLAIAVARLNV